MWTGDAAKIRAKRVRKKKTDREDARHILELLVENHFPKIWVPTWQNRDVRQLLWHRQLSCGPETDCERALVGYGTAHLEQNGELFGVHGLVRSKGLDTADVVRDGDFFDTYLRDRLQSAAKPSVANIDYSMLKNYLKRVALLILNIPFSLGLLIILERRMQFDTPGYWVAKRAFGARLGKDFGPMAWTSLGVDFILCFAVVWVLSLLCLGIIHEVER